MKTQFATTASTYSDAKRISTLRVMRDTAASGNKDDTHVMEPAEKT